MLLTRKHFIKIILFLSLTFILCDIGEAKSGYDIGKLKSSKNGADYLVIAPKEFHDELKPLLDHRAGQGMSAALVSPKDIYDEFPRYPVGPWPIKEFTTYASHNWKKGSPRYLLLVGDINVFENYEPGGQMIPTFIVRLDDEDEDEITASDAPFGDVDGDEVPDIAVGRIPADSEEEVAAAVKKIIEFETDPAPGPWRRRASVFASTGNFGIFDTTLEETTKRLVRGNFNPVFDLNMTYGGSSMPYFQMPEDFKQKVIERFNSGSLFMTYIGHGSVTGLSSVCYKGKCERIMQNRDVGGIQTGGRNPFFFSICCLTGKFNIHEDAIAEEMFKQPDGPIGVFAASEVSHPYSNTMFSKDIMHYMLDRRPRTIGEGFLNLYRSLVWKFDSDRRFIDKQYALLGMGRDEQTMNSYNHIYMYNYIGDPATQIPYADESIEIEAPAEAGPGERIRVSVRAKAGKSGRLLFTLESHPTEIIYDITEIEELDGGALAEAVKSNYQNANNKVAYATDTQLNSMGAAQLEFDVPAFIPGGTYYLKAYAWDGTPDAMGIAEIEVSNPEVDARIAAEEEAAEKRKRDKKIVTFKDRIDEIIPALKEPELPEDAYLYTGRESEPKRHKNIKGKSSERKRMSGKPSDKSVAAILQSAEKSIKKDQNIERTTRALRRAETLSPRADELVEIARLYERLNLLADARAALSKAVMRQESGIRSLIELARVTDKTGDPEAAVRLLDKALQIDKDYIDALRIKARILASMDKLEQAEEVYIKAEELADDYSTIHRDVYYFYLNSMYDREKAEKKAREIIDRKVAPYWRDMIYSSTWLLLKKDRDNIEEVAELMWLYYRAEDHELAKAMALARTGVAFYSFLRDKMKSRAFFDASLELEPGCYECATLKWQVFDADEKKRRCEKAVEIDPERTEAYLCLADAAFEKDHYAVAAQHFRSLREIDPRPVLRAQEIISLYRSGSREDALSLMRKAESSSSHYVNDPGANLILDKMTIFNEIEDIESVYELYMDYTARWPHSFFVHQHMAELCAGREDYEQAAEYQRLAVDNNLFCGDCLLQLGKYNIEAGQYAGAVAALRKGALVEPYNAHIQAELARALARKGDTDGARAILNELSNERGYYYLAMDVLEELIPSSFYLN